MVRPRSSGAASTLVGHNRAAETIVRKVVGECPGYESGAGAAGTFACVCGTNAQRVNNCLARENAFLAPRFSMAWFGPPPGPEPAYPVCTEHVPANLAQVSLY